MTGAGRERPRRRREWMRLGGDQAGQSGSALRQGKPRLVVRLRDVGRCGIGVVNRGILTRYEEQRPAHCSRQPAQHQHRRPRRFAPDFVRLPDLLKTSPEANSRPLSHT
jgi:hypothetical protein